MRCSEKNLPAQSVSIVFASLYAPISAIVTSVSGMPSNANMTQKRRPLVVTGTGYLCAWSLNDTSTKSTRLPVADGCDNSNSEENRCVHVPQRRYVKRFDL